MLPINILHGGYSFLVFLIVHIIVWRIIIRKGVFLLWSLAALVYIFSFAFAFFVLHLPISSLWGSLFFYAFLGITYTRFYITLSRTLTLRFLEELLTANNHVLSDDQFKRIFPARHAFVIRLRTLQEHAWIIEKNGYYIPTRKCIVVGWIIRKVRQVYGIHHAG